MANNDVILEKLKGIEKLFNEKFEQNGLQHEEIKDELRGKSNKWTESFIIWGMRIVLTLIISSLMALVILKPTTLAMNYLINFIG